MGYNGYTDKKKKSNEKYLQKFANIKMRVLPEEKRIIEEKAKKAGKSVNRYIKDLALNSD